MDLQTTLLVAALAITLLSLAAYAWLLRERIRGLEEQRKGLQADGAQNGRRAEWES